MPITPGVIPAARLTLVGVTGTNGKTTTTYVLEQVFRAAGMTPGVIGTTGVRVDGQPRPLARTTPEAPDLHRLLAGMAEEGVEGVAMEVSSHGLDQHRVGGARFSCAVFTNLSQDHLDYHGTLEAYFEAKAKLFTPAMAAHAAVNHDSPEGRRLLGRGLPTMTYGIGEGADVRATDVRLPPDGIAFRVDGLEVRSELRGHYNVHNCLAALTAARQVGIDDAASVRGIAAVPVVPGRLEPVRVGQPFQVLVDYAHTPDSVENVLRAAIRLALGEARSGDVVVIAGKGHETGQEFADRTIPFDDRVVAAEELERLR